MAAKRSSFGKLERARAKSAKGAAKRAKRQGRADPDAPGGELEASDPNARPEGQPSTDELLQLIEALHQRFEAGTIDYEEFEERKAELLGRLSVD